MRYNIYSLTLSKPLTQQYLMDSVILEPFRVGSKLDILKSLKFLDEEYWTNSKSLVPDEIYDAMVRLMKRLEPGCEYFEKNVEVFSKNAEKLDHVNPMLSLEKAYSVDEVVKWCKKVARTADEEFVVSPKFDGISAVCCNGQMLTRGDGKVGEVITDKVRYLKFKNSETKREIMNSQSPIKGELVIPNSLFKDKYLGDHDQDPTKYPNPRNMVSGLMMSKDPKKIEGKGIEFMDYRKFSSQTMKVSDISGFLNIKLNISRSEHDYPIDGWVIKLVDDHYCAKLGHTSSVYKHSIALKYENVQETTKLNDIEWGMSRTGRLSPVALLQPVHIDGCVIKRASLHNPQILEKLGIGIGCTVMLERAGAVIPKIVDVLEPGMSPDIPTKCPFCNAPTERIDRPSGWDLHCSNQSCCEKVSKISEFVGKLFDIKSLGEAAAIHIAKSKKITTTKCIPQFLSLTKSEASKFPKFGEKKAKTLVENIQAQLKHMPQNKFLKSLGVDGIGETIYSKILEKIEIEDLIGSGIPETISIEGVSDITRTSINKGLVSKENFDYYKSCKKYINMAPISKTNEALNNSSKTIYFTGKLPFSKKDGFSKAKELGYNAVGGVTKNTDLVVTDDQNTTNRKKAEKYDIEIISSDKFLELYGNI